MQCRRRTTHKLTNSRVENTDSSKCHRDEEIPPTMLTATSKSHYLWPLSLFEASNVLEPSEYYYWNAGRFAPATLRIDIANTAVYVTRIELEAVMVPAMGKVRHEIRLGRTQDTMHTAYWFTGVTIDGECVQIQLVNGTDDLRSRSNILEIITHESPSWIAWRRIRVWKAVC
jgi:hypothetical protein